MARLRRCDGLWGACAYVEALPAIERVAEAEYLPVGSEGGWGLFADGRRLGRGDGAPRGDLARGPTEDGPFLYVGPVATHYGHFLVDTLPHLWPLLAWEGPRPRLLCHAIGPRADWHRLDVLRAALGHFGYALDDLVAFDGPVRVRDVAVPETSLLAQARVHAVFGELCRAIGRPHWQDRAADAVARPLYLSKTGLSSGVARIVNEAEIEAALARRGVEIAHPETLTFPDQVALLSERRIVLGSAGSAFHTAAFAAPGRRLVGLNWARALNANFALVDRAAGIRARYYHPHGTRYAASPEWSVGWSVAEPEEVAADLLRRAEWLDRGLSDGKGTLAAMRRGLTRGFARLRGS